MMDAWTVWLGERLFTASTHGAVVIALVWLVCRARRVLPAAWHATLWWLAALKLLLAFTPAPSIGLPVLPANVASWVAGIPSAVASAATRNASSVDGHAPFVDDRAASFAVTREVPVAGGLQITPRDIAPAWRGIVPGWLPIAVGLWLAFVAAQAVRLLREFLIHRRIVGRATAWPDDCAGELTALVARAGLRDTPHVRLSDDIDGPRVSGVWRPVVLLPTSVLALTDDERAMALGHELMHIRRRDLVMGWVPALAERLFFFHPLARLAACEYVTAREAACDAAVVRTLGVAPGDYGQLLVRLGVSASRPVFAAGGAALSRSSLRRRLEMLQHIESSGGRYWRWAAIACLLALLPLQLVASTPGHQSPPAEALQAPASAVTAPASPVAPPEERPVTQATPVERDQRRTVRTPELIEREAGREIERAIDEVRRTTQDAAAQEEMRNAVAELARLYERQVAAERTQPEAASEQAAKEQIAALLENIGAQRARVQRLEEQALKRQLDQSARQQAIGDSLRAHVDQLRAQQEMLTRQLQQLLTQQEQLAEAQRHLADQAEQLRRALDARSR